MDAANDPLLRHDHGIDEERRLNIRSTVACADGGCGLSDPEDIVKRKAMTRKLVTAIVVCIIFMLVEVGGGIYAGSLAILTDAAHLLSDVASFAISLFAIYASGWDATPKQSYGFHRVEILGALVSIHIIWLITGILVYEAISRFIHESQPVKGKIMFIIATMGLIVNIGMMLILGEHGHGHSHGGHGHSHGGHAHSHSGHVDSHNGENHTHHHGEHEQHDHAHEHGNSFHLKIDDHHGSSLKLDTEIEDIRPKKNSNNVNVKGAYLHVLGDLIQSIGVMFAGALIWYNPNWKVADLICTLFFSVLVLLTTVSMWRDISDVLMESTPREIDATQLEDGLKKIYKVQAVHELHIWAITLGKVLLACHVKIEHDADADEVLKKVIEYCERDFKISHVTIQIERD